MAATYVSSTYPRSFNSSPAAWIASSFVTGVRESLMPSAMITCFFTGTSGIVISVFSPVGSVGAAGASPVVSSTYKASKAGSARKLPIVISWAWGADFLARSAKVVWTTARSQSEGILSTEVLITVISGRFTLMRLRNFVAPMAEDPMPASQANTIFLMVSAFSTEPGTTVWPFASAFMAAISLWASSRLFPPAIFTKGAATAKDTPAEINTPTITFNISGPGVIII